MKQWQVHVMNVGQTTDLEVELNELGKSGWHIVMPFQTPFGLKFLLERETDDEVSVGDELSKKFGI